MTGKGFSLDLRQRYFSVQQLNSQRGGVISGHMNKKATRSP
jgi:hypothetical protein